MPADVRGFMGSGAAPPLSRPAPPQDSRTRRLWGHPTWTDAGGGWGAQSNGVSFILLSCGIAAKWPKPGEAAHIIWNLLGMTKGSVSCMLATFQGLPRWF